MHQKEEGPIGRVGGQQAPVRLDSLKACAPLACGRRADNVRDRIESLPPGQNTLLLRRTSGKRVSNDVSTEFENDFIARQIVAGPPQELL